MRLLPLPVRENDERGAMNAVLISSQGREGASATTFLATHHMHLLQMPIITDKEKVLGKRVESVNSDQRNATMFKYEKPILIIVQYYRGKQHAEDNQSLLFKCIPSQVIKHTGRVKYNYSHFRYIDGLAKGDLQSAFKSACILHHHHR